MAKNGIFTKSVTSKLNKEMRDDIRKSIIGSKEMAKEIKRVLQQANRRAQNIEQSGVVSPAYQSLVLEGREGYSKFSITGLNIENETQWENAKYEYSKAIEYLNNPTSSSTGARQYLNYISKEYKLPPEVANNILLQATSTEFSNNAIPLLNYRAMIDLYVHDSKDASKDMSQNAEQLAQQLESQVTETTDAIVDAFNQVAEDITNNLANAFKIK